MNASGLGRKQGQPWSLRFDDRYYSAQSGLDETVHVFLRGNGLPERLAALPAGRTFRIGETGFGTGLNFLRAWQLFEAAALPDSCLEFRSVEAFPLAADELRAALAPWPSLHEQAQALLQAWPDTAPGRHLLPLGGGRVRLVLDIDDVAAALPSWADLEVDAWFLDGFAPAKNPTMWSDAVLAAAARASARGATFAAYTSAGWVRRGLQRAGFEVQRTPRCGRKRKMLAGRLADPRPAPG